MRYWTSDLHLGHLNIIDFCERPFRKIVVQAGALGDVEYDIPDVDAMNKALIDNWNDVVDVGDEVWVVGDLAMGRLQTTVPMAKALKGNKFLVPGNHDACHKMHGKWKRFVPLYEDAGFTILDSQVITKIDGTEVLVCHFPYTGDSQFNDRFSGNRPDDLGDWLIHGHTHSDVRLRGKQIHVGVDAWGLQPASEDDIIALIQKERYAP